MIPNIVCFFFVEMQNISWNRHFLYRNYIIIEDKNLDGSPSCSMEKILIWMIKNHLHINRKQHSVPRFLFSWHKIAAYYSLTHNFPHNTKSTLIQPLCRIKFTFIIPPMHACNLESSSETNNSNNTRSRVLFNSGPLVSLDGTLNSGLSPGWARQE